MSVKNNNFTLLSLLFINLFYVAGILVVYFTTYYKSDYVHYKKCNAPLGEYALEAGSSSSNIIQKCGRDKKSFCTKPVSNLKEAEAYCNNNSNICDRFVFNETTKIASIVDLKGEIKNSDNSSIFTRQVGITYDSQQSNNNAYNSQVTIEAETDTVTVPSNISSGGYAGSVSSNVSSQVTTGGGGGGGGY